MKGIIVVVLVVIFFVVLPPFLAMPLPQEVYKAAVALNYKDPSECDCHYFGSHVLYGCDKKDYWACTFSAVNISGQRVALVACKGLFKGYTVRVR